MRNDFYIGIYEDQYLAHGLKGWAKKAHKYLDRYWKNNKWYYIYEDVANAMKSNYHQRVADMKDAYANAVLKNKRSVEAQYRKDVTKQSSKFYKNLSPRQQRWFYEQEKKRKSNPEYIEQDRQMLNATVNVYKKTMDSVSKARSEANAHRKQAERYGRKSGEAEAKWRTEINKKAKTKRKKRKAVKETAKWSRRNGLIKSALTNNKTFNDILNGKAKLY